MRMNELRCTDVSQREPQSFLYFTQTWTAVRRDAEDNETINSSTAAISNTTVTGGRTEQPSMKNEHE